jgi:hypothetical protein
MDDRIALVFLNRFDQRGQVPYVPLHDGDVGTPELVGEKILSRRDIIKHDGLTPFDCMLRIRSADQS